MRPFSNSNEPPYTSGSEHETLERSSGRRRAFPSSPTPRRSSRTRVTRDDEKLHALRRLFKRLGPRPLLESIATATRKHVSTYAWANVDFLCSPVSRVCSLSPVYFCLFGIIIRKREYFSIILYYWRKLGLVISLVSYESAGWKTY